MLRNLIKIIKYLLGSVLLLLLNVMPVYAENSPNYVNILTWWGYLEHPEIVKSAEKACGAKIIFDVYYSNDEFLRRWREQKKSYDIIVFSNTIYNLIKDEIPKINNSHLWQQSKDYNVIIKNKYISRKFPKNVVFFMHCLTGFLYNTKVITISRNDSILTIFKKANHKIVILINDPYEAKKLLDLSFNKKSSFLNVKYFSKLSKYADIYISNGLNNIYKSPNFSFAFIWSGEVIKQVKASNLSLKFLIHPQLSYVSSDLLAQINDNRGATCIANYLTDKKNISIIENKSYYFSSYTDINKIDDDYFKIIYKMFITTLPKLKWIDSVNSNEFDQLNNSWELIKLNLLKNNS